LSQLGHFTIDLPPKLDSPFLNLRHLIYYEKKKKGKSIGSLAWSEVALAAIDFEVASASTHKMHDGVL
jgi:hypothetical protein